MRLTFPQLKVVEALVRDYQIILTTNGPFLASKDTIVRPIHWATFKSLEKGGVITQKGKTETQTCYGLSADWDKDLERQKRSGGKEHQQLTPYQIGIISEMMLKQAWIVERYFQSSRLGATIKNESGNVRSLTLQSLDSLLKKGAIEQFNDWQESDTTIVLYGIAENFPADLYPDLKGIPDAEQTC